MKLILRQPKPGFPSKELAVNSFDEVVEQLRVHNRTHSVAELIGQNLSGKLGRILIAFRDECKKEWNIRLDYTRV